MKQHQNEYKIHINGSWDLKDLYEFARAYEQIYFFLNSLLLYDNKDQKEIARIKEIYKKYSERKRHNSTYFYSILILPEERLQITSIKYGSPGFIELLVNIDIANTIKDITMLVAAVGAGAATLVAVDEAVARIIKRANQAIKFLKSISKNNNNDKTIDSKRYESMINDCGDDLLKIYKITMIDMKQLNSTTGNAEISFKFVQLIIYKFRKLAKYKHDEKL